MRLMAQGGQPGDKVSPDLNPGMQGWALLFTQQSALQMSGERSL